MKNKKKKCPHFIIRNDEPTCKEAEGLCFIKNYKDCKLYRQIKQEKSTKKEVRNVP